MFDVGRVLRFKRRETPAGLSRDEAVSAARSFLSSPVEDRNERDLLDPDVLMAICKELREQADISPLVVAKEASSLYRTILSNTKLGAFDERDYFLGESALLAGGAYRLLGQSAESERWLNRAEAGFRHTLNSAPSLSSVAYARLALRFAAGQYEDVLELLPSLVDSFRKLVMPREIAKCHFLSALTLKALGRLKESAETLEVLRSDPSIQDDIPLFGQVLVHIGDYHGCLGEFRAAVEIYERALPLVRAANRPFALAELKWSLGSSYRAQERFADALEAFRSAKADFATLGMRTYVAFVHLATAELLLTLNRSREAEWEVLAALPTIEDEKMLPEGVAALALLRESVRRRKTDPDALRQLQAHLRAKA